MKFSKTALGLILEANLEGYIKHNPPKALSKATLEGCIMSSPTIQAIQAMKARFAPRKPKIVLIGKTSVLLSPKVDPLMSDPEKTMAYQQNRTALATADLDQHARILALAERLNLMLTA